MNNPYLAPAPAAPYDHVSPAAQTPYGSAPDDRGAQVSDMAVEMLKQTRPWVMFLSVMSFLGSAFMLIGGVVIMAAGALVPSGTSAVPTSVLGAIYIPMAFLYIYPALKLWGYGGAINRLVASRTSTDLEAALAQQKSFWKFAGIVTISMMALYAVAIVAMVVVGIASAGRAQ